MIKPSRRGVLALSLLAGSSAAAGPEAACSLLAGELRITVHSEPDDGLWGPTLEIEVADALRPLARLMAPEPRPVEACWWSSLSDDPAPNLVIGLGAHDSEHGGVLRYAWRDGLLQRVEVPPLPAPPGQGFRYVVRERRLQAWPLPGPDGLAPEAPAWQFANGRWSPDPALQRP